MAMVGYFAPPFGLVKEPRIMPLEHAASFRPLTNPNDPPSRGGFYILVDPGIEEDLVRWEQVERSRTGRRRWLDV